MDIQNIAGITCTIMKQAEPSKKLAVILPGLGYTVLGPLLHYPAQLAFSHGYDILKIQYQYNPTLSFDEVVSSLYEDVPQVLATFLQTNPYTDYCLIGKSLGTYAMASVLQQSDFQTAATIWLTPLLQEDPVYLSMTARSAPGISFIGSADTCYVAGRFQTLNESPIQMNLIPDADHTLELSNSRANDNLAIIMDILNKIDHFLTTHKK
ncbi:hypothetical protein [Bacillus sp. JCM 19041]|uniref:hypothetical protein n=1 Tax=Bacillus sp. JCM 19041 TaxID=1460637 RepID=UPI0006CF5870